MNPTRQAILGQVLHLTRKDLTAYNEFTSSYLETLQPKGAVENATGQHLRRSPIPSTPHSRRRTQPLRSRTKTIPGSTLDRNITIVTSATPNQSRTDT